MASFPPHLPYLKLSHHFVFTLLAISEFFLSLSKMGLKDQMSQGEEGKVANYVAGGVEILWWKL